MSTKNIYIISGLGADERVFQRLDFGEFEPHFVQWISPEKNETIASYAKRIRQQIPEPEPVLIGLSFGGMMIMEIAKQIKTGKIIVISSAKTRKELPFYYRWIGFFRIHKLIPVSLLKRPNRFTYWIFGATSGFEKECLKVILQETDPNYLKWSVNVILNWKNKIIPKNLTHIHGTNDHILPIRFVSCDVEVKNGGHFMILNRAEELSSILLKVLQ